MTSQQPEQVTILPGIPGKIATGGEYALLYPTSTTDGTTGLGRWTISFWILPISLPERCGYGRDGS